MSLSEDLIQIPKQTNIQVKERKWKKDQKRKDIVVGRIWALKSEKGIDKQKNKQGP